MLIREQDRLLVRLGYLIGKPSLEAARMLEEVLRYPMTLEQIIDMVLREKRHESQKPSRTD